MSYFGVNMQDRRVKTWSVKLWVALIMMLTQNSISFADDVYVVGIDGKETLKAHDVIVKEKNDNNVQYHQLNDGVIEWKSCYWHPEKGETARVVRSTAKERNELRRRWASKSIKAEVVDSSGLTTTVSNLAFDFDSPEGYMLITGPGAVLFDPRHYIEIERGKRTSKVDFAEITQLSMRGNLVELTLISGGKLSGPLKYPDPNTFNLSRMPVYPGKAGKAGKARVVPKVEGMEVLQGKTFLEFSLDLQKVKTIRFKHEDQANQADNESKITPTDEAESKNAAQFSLVTDVAHVAQKVVKDKAYQISIAPGWIRTESVPQGLDVGFRKQLAKGKYATFYFHHEVMPSLGEPPSDTSDMKRQWYAMLRNKYPDTRSVAGEVPNVRGTIIVNGTYELTDDGEKVRRRYTYFLAGRTAFVVQCSTPPTQWQTALSDFNTMLTSLQPGSSPPKTETKSDKSAIAELKRDLPTLLGSFPAQWKCSLSDASITPGTPRAKRALETGISFARPDIVDIYEATKLTFGMMKSGKTDDDLNSLPAETQRAASHGVEFVEYVGQVLGYAGGYVAASCDPPIERYKVSIIDYSGKKIGSISVSRDDLSAILSGKVSAADAERVAGMYVFE